MTKGWVIRQGSRHHTEGFREAGLNLIAYHLEGAQRIIEDVTIGIAN